MTRFGNPSEEAIRRIAPVPGVWLAHPAAGGSPRDNPRKSTRSSGPDRADCAMG